MSAGSYIVRRVFFLRVRRPPRSKRTVSAAASDVYKGQVEDEPDLVIGEARVYRYGGGS